MERDVRRIALRKMTLQYLTYFIDKNDSWHVMKAEGILNRKTTE